MTTESRIRRLLASSFSIDPDRITAQARLEDLGIDSIGLTELIFSIEDEFKLRLHDDVAELSTFGAVVRYVDNMVALQQADSSPSTAAAASASSRPTP